ncbi:ATP-dependent DNA helicase isoform X2 [Tasmannia lanceolata]|uniref:ATP-dependent DNA helicase isoform X2 n=1 Tax=Tasmannia lanceolata TaxID=3420 RepID=UPI004063FAF0
MVQLVNSGNLRPDSVSPIKFPVKLEIEDPLDEEHGPLNKKSKFLAPFQKWSTGSSNISPQTTNYNPLDEPSPLGLRLRKSPSLLDLIQMRLSQGNGPTMGVANGENIDLGKKDFRCSNLSGICDKLKASNFPVSLLRIGTWECISRYEGDLVAKCYYAKHKLVWEVLDGGLKSKIEIQWSDITALKATCPEDGVGTLDIVLARQPLFFRETNPQPRKHTLWQATSDFTGGQASIHRRHFLQCPQGLLNKHFEKLIQCDPRLNLLTQQPDVVLDSPYFESKASVFEDQDESKCHDFDHLKSDYVPTFPAFRDAASPCAAQSTSSMSERRGLVSRAPDAISRGTPSPSSVMDSRAIEENGNSKMGELKEPNHWDQFKVPLALRTSMSMSDLVNHIGNCISEQMTSDNPHFSGEGLRGKDMLDEITQYLFSDSQFSSASDEQSLMTRVNSLCCLLQKDSSTVKNSQIKTEENDGLGFEDGAIDHLNFMPEPTFKDKGMGEFSALSVRKQPPAMSRKESFGDLLLHLPRIASLPQFLFNISEDMDNQAR